MSVNDKFASFVEALMEEWTQISPDCYEFDGLGAKAKIEKTPNGTYDLRLDAFFYTGEEFSSIRSAKLFFAEYLKEHVVPNLSYKQKTGIDPSALTEGEVVRIIESSVVKEHGTANYNFYKNGEITKQVYIYDKGFDAQHVSSFINHILINNGSFKGLVSKQRLGEQGYHSVFSYSAIYEWELQNGTFVTVEVGCIKLDDFQYENNEGNHAFNDCSSQS